MTTPTQPPQTFISMEELARLASRDSRSVRPALATRGIEADALAILGQRRIPLFNASRIPEIIRALSASIELKTVS